jgi:hypothetical protein
VSHLYTITVQFDLSSGTDLTPEDKDRLLNHFAYILNTTDFYHAATDTDVDAVNVETM